MSEYTIIGTMSGTSLDGLDMVLCRFLVKNNAWKYKIIKAETYNYTEAWQKRLSEAGLTNAVELYRLHNDFGVFTGQMVKEFLRDISIQPDYIASHGHTVFHQPENRFTLQIGNGAFIAAETKISTIADFRSLDVALGGQGAPLVPVGDKLLFKEYDACLNLGGIANISYSQNNQMQAFDICPCNMLINNLVHQTGHAFDKDGIIGSMGTIHHDMLKELNELDYYHITTPKSLGREWFEIHILPVLKKYAPETPTALRTVYEHIAQQITNIIHNIHPNGKVLVTGGGAFNSFLIQLIKDKNKAHIHIPDNTTVSYKEALIFALLGALRIREEINCLASVTGAERDSSGGVVFSKKH